MNSKPISIIIITYNRPNDALALLNNLTTLQNWQTLLQEVVIVNNQSTEDYGLVEAFITSNSHFPFIYTIAPENLGVTKGRNYALDFAKGDICIFLDDDAELQQVNTLESVVKSFNAEGFNNRHIGIVSFKVLYYSNLQMQVNALPHKQFKLYKDLPFFYTYYFAGGAHAIKREVLLQIGKLPQEFFYGMEEYDVSYRLIERGFCIKYDANIVMLHKESPEGRKPKWQKLQMMWVNKAKVSYRYLPLGYFVTTALMWSFQFLKESNFNITQFIKGWQLIMQIPKTEKRTPLSNSSLLYLQKVRARLWY